jgi:hypothetical protein
MSTQLTIDAIDQVIEAGLEHANAEWRRVALATVRLIADTREFFTTDDVWALLDATGFTTSDPRAMGGVMRTAKAQGFAAPTSMMEKSRRPECHYRLITVWASRLHADEVAA